MQALHDVVQAGWVTYIGMSSCWAWQFQIMQRALLSPLCAPIRYRTPTQPNTTDTQSGTRVDTIQNTLCRTA
jgi:aryl-alcohol dehydrogenase-like predicted oxidoreductase